MGIIDKNLSLRNRDKMYIGVFEDEDKLVSATQSLVDAGIKIHDIYTPYPVHGLERIMGVKRSNLSVIAFLCGATGLSLAVLMIWYMYVYDWPMNVGNKPETRFTPAWVPVMFESMVLCTAFGMAFFFFWRNRLAHGIIPELLDIRQTDDRLIIAVDSTKSSNADKALDIMGKYGAVELREKIGGIQTQVGGTTQSVSSIKTEAVAPIEALVEKVEVTLTEASGIKELSEEEVLAKTNVLLNTVGVASADQADDLKDIVGIGPKYESDLHSLGIFTFEQLSKLTPEAIEAIESLTKNFPGKIEREDWIGQAKDFLAKRNNNN